MRRTRKSMYLYPSQSGDDCCFQQLRAPGQPCTSGSKLLPYLCGEAHLKPGVVHLSKYKLYIKAPPTCPALGTRRARLV
jgi:hypothetical protein